MPEFRWRDGARCSLPPEVVGTELNRIEMEHGTIEPPVVVEEARAVDSPIHDAFEWRDEVAGELWRVKQARSIIRDLEFVDLRTGASLPAYYWVEFESGKAAYKNTEFVLQSRSLFQSALANFQRHLASLKHSIATLANAASEAKDDRKRDGANRIVKKIGELEDEAKRLEEPDSDSKE